MAITSPKQAVYYYEASNGHFRLVYFMPPEELDQLSRAGNISKEVLNDNPDGVDLSCTELDFRQFEELYGYRPPYDPEALQRAFFAIFSGTRNWKRFRGSDLIPADTLREAMELVEESLRQIEPVPEKIQTYSQQMPLKKRRRIMRNRIIQQKRTTAHLERMKVKRVNPKRSLRRQDFPEIQMQKGKSAEEIFNKLLRQQKQT